MLLPSASGFSPHPPVSVYGTGGHGAIAAFLGTKPARFPTLFRSASRLRLWTAVFLSARLLRLHRFSLSRTRSALCVPAVLAMPSTGISACCPSATDFSLALGPDLPRADQLYPGNLGYPAGRIPAFLSLLIPAFSLPGAPLPLTVQLRRAGNAPLPRCQKAASQASAACFSPGHFGAGPLG